MLKKVFFLFFRNVSTTIDPLWEISLDIPEPPSEGGLLECLYHFTRAEPLGSSGKINCTVCKGYQEVTKQCTFKLLPLIIVIQLKVLLLFFLYIEKQKLKMMLKLFVKKIPNMSLV